MLNLVQDDWIPVLNRSGRRSTLSPAAITTGHDTDPVVALDWPRPDFNVAGLEFLAGLLATACPPDGPRDWLARWHAPPGTDALAAAFAPLAHAFDLDGAGPRFLQDHQDLVSDAEPVERLLIESPGGSTTAKNTDLFVRRGRVASFGRPAAAMALYTFQSWAPAGGAGNRTGLRGGGPLVTMVLPNDAPTLWQTLWANIPPGEPAEPHDLPRIFPWLAPTLGSGAGAVVVPEDGAHPLQCWWGMPRRIRLDFGPAAPCGLTGVLDEASVTGWRQRPHGPNYAAWGGVHPLTPTYQNKPGEERLAVHPQPGGIGYQHWLGLVQDTPLRHPAPSVALWRDRQLDVVPRGAKRAGRLLAAGFDMDNMKARGFVESIMPLPPAAADPAAQERLDALVERMVVSATLVAGMVRGAVKAALFSAGATVPADANLLSLVRERLWSDTEAAFFDTIASPPSGPPDLRPWHALLRRTALALFDEAAPLDPDAAPVVRMNKEPPRQVRARRFLLLGLGGFTKDGAALFTALGLAAAAPRGKKGKAA